MSVIQINDQALIDKLQSVSERLSDTLPLTAAIAQSLATVTDDNFDVGGRPTWAGRKASTIKSYQRQGVKYKGVLQKSGELRNRILPGNTRNEAWVGVNLPYAATMQFGAKKGQFGKTKRNTPIPWGDIEPRPFLPMDENSNLQPEAEDAIFDDVDFYWRKIFD